MSFLQAKYPGNLRSEALLCVVDFPASETQIYLARPASHHLKTRASGFAVLVIMRIKLFVCPSMQLAHCRTSSGLWIHRHVRIPTRNLYAVTQHLLTRRNFTFLNSPRGFRRSLEERSHNFKLLFFFS